MIMKHSKYAKVDGKYVEWAAWILDYEPYNYPADLEKVTKLITSKLSTQYCPPKYREGNLGNPMFGHCYHSTQAVFYFFKNSNLSIYSNVCEYANFHWFLMDKDKNIIDITADQYYSLGRTPPYKNAKKSSWYGWRGRPNRATQKLMHEVQPTSKLYFEKYMEKPKQSY